MVSNNHVGNECSTVRAEIYSANTQASVVLAAVAVAAGLIVSSAKASSYKAWPVTGLVIIGGVSAAAAVWSLLDVVLPRLDASGRGSFLSWAELDRDELSKALAEDYQLDELLVLSRIATAKYRCLRRAGRLLRIALVALAAAAVLNLTS